MLRRSVAPLSVERTRFPAVPDLNDWSPFEDRMVQMATGRQFDKTVLDKSTIPTMHLQGGLLRLPIPKLDATLDRYLKAVEPITAPDTFAGTKRHVEAFRSGPGRDLQGQLVATDKANKGDSYIGADWFDLYLRDRAPLPINYNPLMIARVDPDKADGLIRAAFWIASSVRWHRQFRANELKPEVFYFCKSDHYCRSAGFERVVAAMPQSLAAKAVLFGSQFHAFPLDMSQYKSLMATTRLPGLEVDTLKHYGTSRHVIINYRGNQFKVGVADDRGAPLPEGQIYARLKQIVDSNPAAPAVDVGVFTADNRDAWAANRRDLAAASAVNVAALEAVDSALLVVNLDLDVTGKVSTSRGANELGRHMLAAPSNRWWDKSLSVNVSGDGNLGVLFEHSWGDGVAVLRYTIDTFNDSIGRGSASMDTAATAGEPPEMLRWEVPPALESRHAAALQGLRAEIARMDLYTTVLPDIGRKDRIFKGPVKPDPFAQLAMQLAWWRLYGTTVSTYESCSTAAFKRGRTECIRSATNESRRFTQLFDNAAVGDADKVGALLAAAKQQSTLAKEAKMGNGIDRHLFALRKVAERQGGELPPIFQDPSYAALSSNMISTSSLYSDALGGGGFGPVSPGYGVAYAPADDLMSFIVSSWRQGGPQHRSEEFARAIYASCSEMKALLQRAGPST